MSGAGAQRVSLPALAPLRARRPVGSPSGLPRSVAPPSPFAPDTDWAAWRRAQREILPGWHYDRDYVTSHALDRLPRVCAALGCGDAIAVLPRPDWWFTLGLPDADVALHGLRSTPVKPVVALRMTHSSFDLLFIDRATGEWDAPNLGRCGHDLVALAEWRWGVPSAKAAWRLAPLCGLRRPAP